MVSNRIPQARVCAGLLMALFVLCGCSWLHRGQSSPAVEAAPPAPPPPDSTEAPPMDELTATEAAATAAGTPATAEPANTETAPDTSIVNPNAPKHYTVKRGDTL